ncbi:hypothetical protein AcV7_009746 [Taiwanofungus camphoratus]|nr:hypothetical protein AcV7_009746 [Antrodia cinnamomea]
MDNPIHLLYFFVSIIALVAFVRRRHDPLNRIPAIGPSAPLVSYVGSYRYFHHAQEMLQEGYEKYRKSAFRVPLWNQWAVVVSGSRMNEELRKLPEEQMSFLAAADEFMQLKYTIAPRHPVHVKTMRENLTRNMATLLPDLIDEIRAAVQDMIPTHGAEWVSVTGLPMMTRLIARVSNRAFVGLPTCRDSEYLDFFSQFPSDVVKGKAILSMVPKPLKSLIGPLLPWSRRGLRRLARHLKPIIEERKKALREFEGNWVEKPNDMLMWLIEEAMVMGESTEFIVQGILSANFGSTHTSSISVTHALYHLAGSPQYLQPLREEIEGVIESHGWTKQALSMLWKLDSFMRESQRFNGVSGTSIMRKALSDVTLSDGTRIPAGTFVYAAAAATHRDEENYDNPNVFDPFRFSKIKEESERVKRQFVSTAPDYVPFGHGKYACPGRFFASTELKAILAHIILCYDMKFEGAGGRPDNVWVGPAIIPAPKAKIMFRRRRSKNA